MTRDELIDYLARLVSDDVISEASAQDLLREFDNGTLQGWDLPLPLTEAVQSHNRDNERLAWLALLAFLLVRGHKELRPFPERTAIELADELQDVFAEHVAGLVTSPIAVWQRQMLDAIETHVIEQMYLANGRRVLTRAQLGRLDGIMQEQGAFLSRFADEAAYRAATGAPWSAEYIANRAKLYGGIGRGEFFRGREERLLAESSLQRDVQVYYVSRDDRSTCGPCLDADQGSPYPVGAAPMPGEICLGGGNCRCVLEYR